MLLFLGLACVVLAVLHVVYQRVWHPLAAYPGPFWASITDFWGSQAFWSGQHPYILTELHEKYGPVVRFGPNRLSFISPDVVNTVFVKGFKTLPKTEFYDTFGGKRYPNLFNDTDMSFHSHRRKHLIKLFSPQTVTKWEPILDEEIQIFRETLHGFSATGRPFDIKAEAYKLICDMIARLMYGINLDVQKSGLVQQLPDDHKWTSWNLTLGAMPNPWRRLLPIMFFIPHAQTGWRRNNLSFVLEAVQIMEERRKDIEGGQDVDRPDTITGAFVNNMNDKTEDGSRPLTDFYVANELLGFV